MKNEQYCGYPQGLEGASVNIWGVKEMDKDQGTMDIKIC